MEAQLINNSFAPSEDFAAVESQGRGGGVCSLGTPQCGEGWKDGAGPAVLLTQGAGAQAQQGLIQYSKSMLLF